MFKLDTSESVDLILNVCGWVVRWVGFEGVPSSTSAQRVGFLKITILYEGNGIQGDPAQERFDFS